MQAGLNNVLGFSTTCDGESRDSHLYSQHTLHVSLKAFLRWRVRCACGVYVSKYTASYSVVILTVMEVEEHGGGGIV